MIFEGAFAVLLAAASPAVTDTAAARELLHAPLDPSVVVAESLASAPKRVPDPSRVRDACASLTTDDVIRLEGPFGTFEGRTRRISPTGFEGLEPQAAHASAPQLLRWEQIDLVDVQRSGATKGAATGFIVSVAVVGAAWLAAYAAQGFTTGEYDDPSLTLFIGLAAIPAILAGVCIGGGIGASHKHWEPVYPGR